MESLAIVLSTIGLIAGLLTTIKIPSGLIGGILWLPKLWAGAWSPLFLLLSFIGAVLSGTYQRIIWVAVGLAGAAFLLRYTIIVTRGHTQFEQVFGSRWQASIPPLLYARLTTKRFRLIQPAPPAIPGQRDVVIGESIGNGKPLLCDVWQPPENVPPSGAAILYLHGGLWQAFDKDFLTQPLFRRLGNQGHVVLDLAYPLAPEADLNGMLGDLQQTILWLKEHSADYHISPDRIILMGASGGAHLALMAAYAPEYSAFQTNNPSADMSVRAVISVFGITDLSAFFVEYGRSTRKQPEYSSQITEDLLPRTHDQTSIDRFLTRSRAFPAYRHANMPGGALLLVNLLGGTLREIPEVYRLASPLHHVTPHCPPTLLFAAENDFVIDPSQTRKLYQALKKSGVKCIYREFPNCVHAFDQYFGVSRRIAPAGQSMTYDLERFIALMVGCVS